MTDTEIKAINQEYENYCERDKHALPFIIWLKYKNKINPSEYYGKENK